ncbi:MAG: radical SAM protein [Candidatus Gracilibacteria bacterium]|nr:radical SAM protein [Candidatus Gracilibacteria bacterium]MDD4530158.1 radical SAM protein [Candidatus Gracilibacteria bacterium]
MKRIDLKVGFDCNNMCLFCVQGDKRFKHKPRTKEEIFAKLEEGKKDGATGVVFTGGEPTVHPDIIEAIKYAKKIGYTSIQIQTNGRAFADYNYCLELIEAGVNEFAPSLHGFNPETHDMLVGVPGAWKKTVVGLANLQKLKQFVLMNTVITKQNYKELPNLATLFIKLGVSQFQLAFIHILGSADKNKIEIVPKKSDIIPYVHKALDIGKKCGIICMTEAVPFCLMKGYEWAIAEYNFMPETEVFDAECTIESYAEYRWNEGKAKGSQCKICKYKNICEGPWKEYPEIYGWDEFIAVK